VPPFVGVAVKVTLVPGQIAPDGFAVILTLVGKFGFIVIATATCIAHSATIYSTTHTLPALVPKVTVILFVPAPAVMVAPAGIVQL